jgi:gamma-glutamyltranspeptidase/glutathione hydrolase
VEIEPEGVPGDLRAGLEGRGHAIQVAKRRWGNMQAVFKSKQTGAVQSASDPRGADVGN